MTIKLMLWAVIVALLLTGGVALATSPDLAGESWQVGGSAMLAGQGYQMMSQPWSVCGASSGGGYQLQTLAAPASSENGCCCVYLPVVVR